MAKYRDHLPQLDGGVFLTDSGLETILVFHQKFELPHFAAFDLLRDRAAQQVILDYYRTHATIARDDGAGFVLESPTWRANRDWGDKLGYSPRALAEINREAIDVMAGVRDEFDTPDTPFVISGCIGPRGDGYDPGDMMSADEAQAYHAEQIGIFADTDADMVSALTLTNVDEALGIAREAEAADIPSVLSFTVETDGRLPTGECLADAISEIDGSVDCPPVYYMINCAHPSHFAKEFARGGDWIERIRGLRANASRRSHEELDQATELDDGDPAELAADYVRLIDRLAHVNVLGGCCGTDHRHVAAISAACLATKSRYAA